MRHSAPHVVLVGYQDQGNLGLGYLASVLMAHGFGVTIVDFRKGDRAVLETIRAERPLLVGFSLIFQYYLPRFAELAAYLRACGVAAHITVGGHYPTLRYRDTLSEIPELDSVVLYEGELTLLELVKTLAAGVDWRSLDGVAYRKNDDIVLNPLRPLIENLDELPFPYRPFPADKVLGQKILPVLATRGCPRHCAFCSIREFYGQAPGKIVRRRSPNNVVSEMRDLRQQENASIFLFQDDDFPTYGKAGRRWVNEFVSELKRQGLLGKVIWKISCRVDEVDPTLFAEMQRAGLYLVYLGIESGTETGLTTLNKQVTVGDNLRAVRTLKDLGLSFGYGFMLFDPSSTFDSVRANVAFLRRIVGDGSSAVVFCKMLPYAGTPVEANLAAAGRLTGDVVAPDYQFTDARLDRYYKELNAVTAPWLDGPDALSHTLNALAHEVTIIRRLFPPLEGQARYEARLQESMRQSNETILSAIETSLESFERAGDFLLSQEEMARWARARLQMCIGDRDDFIYRNQDKMLEAIAADAA
jgi:radical SAM superfamily enzyme YgiQ (UPF0313 family)